MAEPQDVEVDAFTVSESKVVLGVLKHLSSDIQADFEAIATELGYKSAEVAKVRWRQVRNKKFPPTVPPGGVDKTSPNKKTPVKAKKAAGEGLDGATPTPKKRGRKPKVETKEQDNNATVKVEDQVAVDGAVPAEMDEHAQDEDGSSEHGVDD